VNYVGPKLAPFEEAFAEITSAGDDLSGHWIVFTLRYMGIWNFASTRGYYNVCIYASQPENWRLFASRGQFPNAPAGWASSGYAVIGLPLNPKERRIELKHRFHSEAVFSLLAVPTIAFAVVTHPRRFLAMSVEGWKEFLGLIAGRLFIAALFWGTLVFVVLMLFVRIWHGT
jgi:hypothetical protein